MSDNVKYYFLVERDGPPNLSEETVRSAIEGLLPATTGAKEGASFKIVIVPSNMVPETKEDGSADY